MHSVSPDSPADKVSSFDEEGRSFLLLKRPDWVMWAIPDPLNIGGFRRAQAARRYRYCGTRSRIFI